MKQRLASICLAAALVVFAGSCAKVQSTGVNDASKRYFDAWISLNYPNAPQTALGSRILADSEGSGSLIGSAETHPFIYGRYLVTDFNGNISSFTDEATAKQLGSYRESAYYGPTVVWRSAGYLSAGVSEMFETMRVGGTRTVAIPGWLTSTTTTDYYDTAEEYLAKVSGGDPAIYTFSVEEAISDIVKWEIDSLSRYMARHYPGVDSTAYGYYYIQTAEPLDTNAFTGGNTVYVNYTGRLLNGQVFDSTIEDTTKRYRLHVEGRTYEPVELSWPNEGESVTFTSGSSAISGFEKCVHAMRAGEKGVCIFYSGLGYGVKGGGSSIPAISPLIFEIQMLGENSDGRIEIKEE